MTKRSKRLLALLGIGLAGTLFQVIPSGCGQFYLYGLTQAFDFCSVLNCNSSTYFNLCAPVILVDCPQTTTTP